MKTHVLFTCPACERLIRRVSDPVPGYDEMQYEMELVCDCGVSSGRLTVGYSQLKTALSVMVIIERSKCNLCGEEFNDDERVFLTNPEDLNPEDLARPLAPAHRSRQQGRGPQPVEMPRLGSRSGTPMKRLYYWASSGTYVGVVGYLYDAGHTLLDEPTSHPMHLLRPTIPRLTGVCKNEIIATNQPRHRWILAYAGMTEWAR